eukprot:5077611-Amphidinium_carterae.1
MFHKSFHATHLEPIEASLPKRLCISELEQASAKVITCEAKQRSAIDALFLGELKRRAAALMHHLCGSDGEEWDKPDHGSPRCEESRLHAVFESLVPPVGNKV